MHVDDPSATTNDELVLLVHGTYAARGSDAGASWWQNGSETSKELQDRLPAGVRLPDCGEVFHWSGENNERARIKAAGNLLGRLCELEAEGQRYHLIGHSHGGSVIWHTLRLATLRKHALRHLRSWATVGTPFLHHRTRSAWNIFNLLKIAFAIVLLKPAYTTYCALMQILIAPLLGLGDGLNAQAAEAPRTLSFFHTPVLKVLDVLGVSVSVMEKGVRIGSYDSSRGDSSVEFLFCTAEGWLVLAVAVLVMYIYLHLGAFLIGPVLESLRIRSEKRLEQNVMETYRGRWLGLWSPDDEAINGLRATLDMSVSFVARIIPRERVLISDHLSLLARPYFWLLAPVFNTVLRPVLDGIVRSRVVKTAQGNNRPAAEVIAVSPVPVHLEKLDHCPPIPLWLNQRIVQSADDYARDLAPKFRRLLAEPSFVSGLEAFGDSISGRELVHTSYFDHSEILDLLTMHIVWANGKPATSSECCTEDGKLVSWLCEWRQEVGADAKHNMIDYPVKPRRRAA